MKIYTGKSRSVLEDKFNFSTPELPSNSRILVEERKQKE
jgi:hypothetical protein